VSAKSPKLNGYARKKSRETARAAAESRQAREIGPLPSVVNPRRKKACRLDLRRFAETYFAGRFPLAWGSDHLDLIADLQRVILDGGRQAEAHPRGSGKTTVCEVAALWAMAYGHRRFVVLIGATETKAEELLDDIKAECEANDVFAGDFPEICYPIRRLEGINNRCAGQLLGNARTRIQWTAKAITFPTVKKKASSGAIAVSLGLTGSIRGLARLVDGRKLRPDLCIIDDPQTDESARSPVSSNETTPPGSSTCGAVWARRNKRRIA